ARRPYPAHGGGQHRRPRMPDRAHKARGGHHRRRVTGLKTAVGKADKGRSMTQHRHSSHRVRTAVCVGISMIAVACGTRGGHTAADASGAGPLTTLTGAGSTFDQPFFAQAFSSYGPRHGVAITYHSIGSGGGIQQFTANKVDFGASDAPMNAAELAAANKT